MIMRRPEQIQRAMERMAEQRIVEAIERGEFDNLPGAGKPIPGIDESYDEHWWIRSWLERERITISGLHA
jgi:hypothetical protein